jgi:hypothetical protein
LLAWAIELAVVHTVWIITHHLSPFCLNQEQ